MLIRREQAGDAAGIRDVHASAFAATSEAGTEPVEVGLVDALRESDAWLPQLAFVALRDAQIIGHVVCTRGKVGDTPALALGPIGVNARVQSGGIGSALMRTVLGAADALDEPLIALLGHIDYYPRFGFRLAAEFGITPPDPTWAPNFMVLPLHGYDPTMRGEFSYPAAFMNL
ncbi:putative acetyltransferase [Tamaricihabitans halophyticus]|uniref:Putative acetyltransferase n=1 Tax=Tamaricihabitans halophyticus TaxID=1262583 RepID=A0A4R2QYD2_9PSEU|nr:N-acetyltransferase [Tamaricihabitans halophyticus]TCP54199.1 putative acetyltransferase [Tamaricihabitans halophyticus]